MWIFFEGLIFRSKNFNRFLRRNNKIYGITLEGKRILIKKFNDTKMARDGMGYLFNKLIGRPGFKENNE